MDKEKIFKLMGQLEDLSIKVKAADNECHEASVRYIDLQKEWDRVNNELRTRLPSKLLTEEIKRR